MFEIDIAQWLEQVRAQLMALLTLALGLQVGVILLALLLGALLQPLTRRLINRLDRQRRKITLVRAAPGLDDLTALLVNIRWPATTYLLSRLGMWALSASGYATEFLAWATPFFLLWLVSRGFAALLERRMTPERARAWSKQLVRPILITAGALHALTLFDKVWSWGVTIQGHTFTLGALIVALLIFYVFWQLAQTARTLLGENVLPRAGVHPSLTQIIASFTAYVIVLVGFAIALSYAGIELTTLTVILGGLSVGLGFAMQDVISNFISGFILLMERSIVPGDVITVDDHFGQVTNVGIRATRIRTLDNVEIIVPNSAFVSGTVENYSSSDGGVRVEVVVGASYSVEPGLVEKALLEAAEGMPILSTPPPSVQFIDFGASSLDFRLLVWLEDPLDTAGIQSQLRYRIWDRFKAHQIPIPFPQRDIHILTWPERQHDTPAGPDTPLSST